MSVARITHAWVSEGHWAALGHAAKAVLVVLLLYPRGMSGPGMRRIARYAGMSERQARTGIEQLTTYGYLKVMRRGWHTNRYSIIRPIWSEKPWGAAVLR